MNAAFPGTKRGNILATAMKFFVENGFSATSMDDIAAATPVSKATLYKYFKDKKALFAAVVQARCQLLCDQIHQRVSQEEHLAAGLKNIANTFWELIHSHEAIKFHIFVISEQRFFPEIGQIFYESGPQQILKILGEYLLNVGPRFGLKIEDPHQAAVGFLNLLKGETHIKALLNVPYSESPALKEKTINHAIQLFLKGYSNE